MTKGLQRSLSRGPKSTRGMVTERLVLNEQLAFTGSTGAAIFSAIALAGLPEGNILLHGAVSNLTFTGPDSDDLADDFQGDYSIGTTPVDDATLSGNDVNVISSTSIPAADAEVSADVRAENATQAVIDNTDGSGELNLNVLLDADEVTDGETLNVSVTGTLDVAYTVLGDD